MLDLICDNFKTQIAALPYSGKVAGLTKTAVRRIEGETEDGQKYLLSEQKFPIASNVVGASCFDNGTYKELAPNSTLKSVIYFEQLSPEIITPETQLKQYEANVKFRLVAWFHLKKIGVTGELPNEIKYELMKILQTGISVTVNGHVSKVRIAINQIVTDPSVFAKYSYEKVLIENMLLYPYAYFAIDCTASYFLNPKCYTFTPLTEIEC